MVASDVLKVLRSNGLDTLYHVNSVPTSCSFLKVGGLASRAYLAANKLTQTSQYTDFADQKHGIWNDVFTDGVDIHDRASRRNFYGPVAFLLPVDALLTLPKDTDVIVMKKNPANWTDDESEKDHYFLSVGELEAGYNFGDFGQHVVFRLPAGIVPFVDVPIRIVLDDPERKLSDGSDAYQSAAKKLHAAASVGGRSINIEKRDCGPGCGCHASYERLNLISIF